MAAFCASAAAAAPLIFTAPPRESHAAAEKLYAPLAKAMSKWAGEPVVFRYAGNWLNYSNEMRAGKYDIVFDGPQFVDWRMVHQGALPLASLPGSLKFIIATKDPAIKTVSGLVARTVCTLPSPNLGALFMLDQFKDPLQQPIVVPVSQGGFKAIYQDEIEGKCAAAVYRTSFYQRQLTDMQRSKLHVIYTSPSAPNQTITAAKSVPETVRKHIAEGLINASGVEAGSALFARFSHGTTHFVKADPKAFKGLNMLLEDVVWGWAKSY